MTQAKNYRCPVCGISYGEPVQLSFMSVLMRCGGPCHCNPLEPGGGCHCICAATELATRS